MSNNQAEALYSGQILEKINIICPINPERTMDSGQMSEKKTSYVQKPGGAEDLWAETDICKVNMSKN